MHEKARVLVVDDEPQLLRLLEQVLQVEYDVSCASDGAVALGLILAGLRFDAIVCDFGMPGLSGLELYRELGDVAPDQQQRMLFLTGGVRSIELDDFVQAFEGRYLQKPFEVAELLALVHARVAA